jgi:hypothetical protein
MIRPTRKQIKWTIIGLMVALNPMFSINPVVAADQAVKFKTGVVAQAKVVPTMKIAIRTTADYKTYAFHQVLVRNWNSAQFVCLESLWTKESNWNPLSTNRSSGAHGIPQALPASKMAVIGADYKTSAITQINWGLKYIDDRYSNPCRAWSHWKKRGWY